VTQEKLELQEIPVNKDLKDFLEFVDLLVQWVYLNVQELAREILDMCAAYLTVLTLIP